MFERNSSGALTIKIRLEQEMKSHVYFIKIVNDSPKSFITLSNGFEIWLMADASKVKSPKNYNRNEKVVLFKKRQTS